MDDIKQTDLLYIKWDIYRETCMGALLLEWLK